MNLQTAVRHIQRKGILLVFPHANKKEPPSLWYEFFPRTPMRWEWDDNGDDRVGQLWHLREQLSISRKVIYSKWFRGKATVLSLKMFTAIIRVANRNLLRIDGLNFHAREILDLLEEDSPLSTKQLKKMVDLQGRANESAYQRALKELWERGLIVAYGEVDEGAFPSIAIGATRVLFEDVWREAEEMSQEDASALLNTLPQGGAFAKFITALKKKWEITSEEDGEGDLDQSKDEES